jgi:spore germination protein KC
VKKTAFYALLFCAILLLPGCWNQVDIEERGIVAALGIDKAAEEGKLAVTVQIIKPGEIKAGGKGQGGGAAGGGEAVAVYTDTGYDLFDALRNLARQTGRKLYFPEMAVLVLGEALAREGVGSVMDFMVRDAEPSMRTWVLVARGQAKEVLKTPIPTEKVWGFGLGKMIKAIKAHSKAPAVNVLDFLKNVDSTTTCPVATGIQIVGVEKKPKQEAVTPGKRPVLGGAAVFKEYQMTGWLDEIQTRGMLWVKGEVKGGIVVVPSPQNENKMLALEIIRAASEIKPEISDGRITVTVKITEEGNIGEVKPDHIEIAKPGVIEAIEAGKREVIENEVWAAVTRAQELNADVFGFGEAVRRKYPREWPQYEKMWGELFPALDVQVKVDAKIRRTGMITNPEKPGESGVK